MINNYDLAEHKKASTELKAEHNTSTHGKEGANEHPKEEGSVINQILNSNLGDHNQFGWFDIFHIDLPKIIIDNGVDFYWNSKSMEADGKYTYEHHTLVKTDNHTPPALNLSVTSLVVYQWIALLLLLIAFVKAGKHYKKNPKKAPRGFTAMIETFIVFVRDEMVKPNIGEKLTRQLLPYFLGLFFFILTMNLLGLVPGGHSATGNLAVTAALAITAFFVIQIIQIRESGIGAYFKHLLGGAPIWLAPIMLPIEIMGLFTKPFALTVRLFANMTAGHVIIFCLLGLIFFFKSLAVAPLSVGFSLFIYVLELLVAFIQAYIFTMLTAVFISLGLGHSHEHKTEHVNSEIH